MSYRPEVVLEILRRKRAKRMITVQHELELQIDGKACIKPPKHLLPEGGESIEFYRKNAQRRFWGF